MGPDQRRRIGIRAGRLLQHFGIRGVGEQAKIVLTGQRFALRQRAVALVGLGQGAGGDLAGLHVGLVEGVNTHDRPRHGGGELPAEEFLTEIVAVGHGDAHHWMPGGRQRIERRRLFIDLAFQGHVHEQPILAISLGGTEYFTVERNDGLALLAGGLGHQLFDPGAETGEGRRGGEGELVPAKRMADAQDEPELQPRILRQRHVGAAVVHHYRGPFEKVIEFHAKAGGGNHAEMGEHGIAPADLRPAVIDRPKALLLGHLLERGTGIGNGHEMPAGLLFTHRFDHAGMKIILEQVGLQGAARLAGDDEQCAGEIQARPGGADLIGIGGVDHVQGRHARPRAEDLVQHFGAHARPAHAQQHHVTEAALLHELGEAQQLVHAGQLVGDDVEPVEPVCLVAARPQARILPPQPGHAVFRFPAGLFGRQRRLHGRRQGDIHPGDEADFRCRHVRAPWIEKGFRGCSRSGVRAGRQWLHATIIPL